MLDQIGCWLPGLATVAQLLGLGALQGARRGCTPSEKWEVLVVQAGGAGREGPVSRKVSVESKTDGGAAKVRMEVRGGEVRGGGEACLPGQQCIALPGRGRRAVRQHVYC